MFDVCLLGTGGMMPTPKRYLSSLIVRCNGTTVLVDCGEGTQIPLQELGWGFKDINIILFTHYHGDHITGLPGIIYQMVNANRTEDLYIYGPPGILVVENLFNAVFPKKLPFRVFFNILNAKDSIPITQTNLNGMIIRNTNIEHSTPCYGYSFEVERHPKFDPTLAKLQNIPIKYWRDLQQGNTICSGDGTTLYSPKMVLGEKRKGIKVAYATDTRPCHNLSQLVKDSDLFIGEGMYGDINDASKAIEKKHSTFQETAWVASVANVKELWLTHYSPSLPNPQKYLNIAQNTFPNTILGKNLMQKTLRFED